MTPPPLDRLPLGREEIEALLPHRDPFLLVDRVEDGGENWLTATWHVPADGWWFRGHYPDLPVLPGVLSVEHALQCGALLAATRIAPDASGVPLLVRIRDARFRRVVQPEDTLITRVQLDERIGPALYMSADIRTSDARVARVAFTVTTAEPEQAGL